MERFLFFKTILRRRKKKPCLTNATNKRSVSEKVPQHRKATTYKKYKYVVRGCKIVPWFPELNGTWLQNHIIQNLTTPTSNQCQVKCFANDSCRSYNFCQELELCQLSNSDHVEHPDDKVPRKGFVYRGTENACASAPCPSGLLCQADFAHDSYICVCPADQPDCLTQTSIICHDEMVDLSCPQGAVLDIQWALYARSAREPCPHSANNICTVQYPQTLAKVQEYCQGKQSCSFRVNHIDLVGFDPCRNVFKYLEVRYACK
ncbi:predicted protein [Nematostella vectensis]|uniref:Uncharacterized protein n=1 Tax=Nematostella vectensis TaxID=45351 RepID=A7SHH8_NEMVE|nr:predicted protein [Nematostella vectensis]|eukprot:XP_001628896.1 predicted protein [Nematostella vectensis]